MLFRKCNISSLIVVIIKGHISVMYKILLSYSSVSSDGLKDLMKRITDTYTNFNVYSFISKTIIFSRDIFMNYT